ncbi:MAG: RNA methyltransferase [Deltaproteobacteria bacterium]|nr:RNA methyltransferase [Deltaproteobacteria bacterium]
MWARSFGRSVVLACATLLSPKDRSFVTPVVCKASAGAIEHIELIKVTNLARTLSDLKEREFWVYGAMLGDNTVPLPKLDPASRSVIVMGSEGKGLRRLVADTCDQLVNIPLHSDFDSLNVAQAGSILLYDFTSKVA